MGVGVTNFLHRVQNRFHNLVDIGAQSGQFFEQGFACIFETAPDQVTAQGLRLLGSGEIEAGGRKIPGVLVPLAVVAATGNPVGLIVGGAAHLLGEKGEGSDTLEGTAKRTAEEIAEELRDAFEKQGWI